MWWLKIISLNVKPWFFNNFPISVFALGLTSVPYIKSELVTQAISPFKIRICNSLEFFVTKITKNSISSTT
jgi:hypothetical protein